MADAGEKGTVNVIYIHTHDLGDWISPLGKAVETPNLEALAAEATVFTNAHAAAPTCSPSRAALLTGTTPHQAGMFGLAHRGFTLERTEFHLANVLKEAGYETALCGLQHEFAGHDIEGFPYQQVIGQIGREDGESMDAYQRRRDTEVATVAADWIRERKDKRKLFLSVGFFQPHRPLLEPDEDIAVGDADIPGKLELSDETREDTAALKTSVRLLDRAVGTVLRALKESGQWERSIILFTTDHGIAFPYHKCSLTDRGTQVALMLRHPGRPETHGGRVEAMVSQLDVVPTLYDWLGMEIPSWCGGKSLAGLIAGKVSRVRESLNAEVNYHAAYEPMRSIRTDRHLLIRRFLNDGGWVLANVDDSLSKDQWLQMPGFAEGVQEFELYDLEADPRQETNLAQEPEYAAVLEELKARLLNWMRATDDPLLLGPVKRPPHSRVNHRNSSSPYEPFYEENRSSVQEFA